jgi:hypothetical protein
VQCTLEKRAGAKGPAAVVLDGPPQDEKALQEVPGNDGRALAVGWLGVKGSTIAVAQLRGQTCTFRFAQQRHSLTAA